jgi:hypothetical protein
MARTPKVANIQVELSTDRHMIGFSRENLDEGITIGNAEKDYSKEAKPPYVNILVDATADYDYLRFSPLNDLVKGCMDTSQFKFLNAVIISDTLGTVKGFRNEWRLPVFELADCKKGTGAKVSTMAIYIDDDLDPDMHNFSIVYWSLEGNVDGQGLVQVWDPGIENQES